MRLHRLMTALAVGGAMTFATACGSDEGGSGGSSGASSGGGRASADLSGLSGEIRIDGSSTVEPFARAAAELFNEEANDVKVTVSGAGTGDGFERFCRGETQISNASRPIEADEEEACEKKNVDFSEVQVANDGIAIVTNPQTQIPNECISVAQLERLLKPSSNVNDLSELGEGFPRQRVQFFTPGEESGTFDFFTETVLETDAEQRTDRVQTSGNDNQLVQGVSGTDGAIGYFGFSFADENRSRLKILQVEGEEGRCVEPTRETIQDNSYKPLSRPIFMYPSAEAIRRPEVKAFMDFIAQNYERIAEVSDIVPMTAAQAAESEQELDQLAEGDTGGTSTTESK